ncbi:MAG: phosphoribosylformylglycinamidine synthase subunit PurQ [Sphaerochaetaceae bacterium]
MQPKIAIIEFPGTNCEVESARAVTAANMEAVAFRWNEKATLLEQYDGFVIPGGSSYEERSRSGIIAALQPIMTALKKEDQKGKPILGISDGAQILSEAGLVPGFNNYKLGISLAPNYRVNEQQVTGIGLYNDFVNIRSAKLVHKGAFFHYIEDATIINLPFSSSSGRFILPKEVLKILNYYKPTMMFYCDAKGEIKNTNKVNPPSSMHNIAALTNFSGNVLAIVPHIERTGQGQLFFDSMHDYIVENRKSVHQVVELDDTEEDELLYKAEPNAKELIIETIINDNSAATVQQTLQNLGFAVKIERLVHWELKPTKGATKEEFAKEVTQVCQSGHLFNPNKEFLGDISHKKGTKFLIRSDEKYDTVGRLYYQQLKKSFNLKSIAALQHAILWIVSVEKGDEKKVLKQILKSNIFNNRYSHKRYLYG